MLKRKQIIPVIVILLVFLFGTMILEPFAIVKGADGNVTYPNEVTEGMEQPSYWTNIAVDADKVLLTTDKIEELNQQIVDASSDTNVVDLESLTSIPEADFYEFKRDLYVNGKLINEQEYLNMFKAGSTYLSDLQYAVAVKRTDLKSWPVNDFVGYSANDPDDEVQLHAINVNEPFVISQKCIVNNHVFYYGLSRTCDGWVDGDCLAIFDSKQDWVDSWKVNVSSNDFIVVTTDQITLEPSTNEAISKLDLYMGTILKLVPENKIPETVDGRSTYYNYVVYVPTRDEKGKYAQQIALVPIKNKVNVGYLPLNQVNILNVAFSSIGKKYGWGSMNGLHDATSYIQAVYYCFGLILPRNDTWQSKIPGKVTDISNMTEVQKEAYIETLPAGTLIHFPGFMSIYVGSQNGINYVINDVGYFSNANEELNLKTIYGVTLNPLTVKRRSGNTWLQDVDATINILPEVVSEKIEESSNDKITSISLKATSKKKAVLLKWNTNTKPDKVIVYYARTNKKFKKLCTLKGKTQYKAKNLKSGKKYKFKVIAVKDGKKVTSKIIKVKAK